MKRLKVGLIGLGGVAEFHLSSYKDISYRITFDFNEELFNLCVDYTNTVWDIVLYLILSEFSYLIDGMKRDNILLRWLNISNCNLSLMVSKWGDV